MRPQRYPHGVQAAIAPVRLTGTYPVCQVWGCRRVAGRRGRGSRWHCRPCTSVRAWGLQSRDMGCTVDAWRVSGAGKKLCWGKGGTTQHLRATEHGSPEDGPLTGHMCRRGDGDVLLQKRKGDQRHQRPSQQPVLRVAGVNARALEGRTRRPRWEQGRGCPAPAQGPPPESQRPRGSASCWRPVPCRRALGGASPSPAESRAHRHVTASSIRPVLSPGPSRLINTRDEEATGADGTGDCAHCHHTQPRRRATPAEVCRAGCAATQQLSGALHRVYGRCRRHTHTVLWRPWGGRGCCHTPCHRRAPPTASAQVSRGCLRPRPRCLLPEVLAPFDP